MNTSEWEERLAAVWELFDEMSGAAVRQAIDELARELPPGDPIGVFERASAFDATDRPDLAVPLYQEALDSGLAGERRRQGVIQMASSLRSLHRSAESVALLTAELAAGSDHLDDAVKTVLALALTDVGREREAVSVAVEALARHLPQYQRSMANYARLLIEAPQK